MVTAFPYVLEGLSATTVAGLGIIGFAGIALQGDAVKKEDRRKVYFHYTNAAGLAGIMSSAKILPDAKGNVYITDSGMSAADAFQNLFLSQPTHAGRGHFVVGFYLDQNQES